MNLRYQVGGALRPGAIYVSRAADSEAEAALLAGDAIHVLGPRQLGKSSLRLKLAQRLAARGLRVASLDLSGMGAPRDADAWLAVIADELAMELGEVTLEALTQPPPGAPRFRYLTRLLQAASEAGPWVLFVDELDALAAYPEAADAVLGALRAAWDATTDAEGGRPFRLCLAGVVAPFELGADPNRTPFNVSRPIHLTDFSASEAEVLAEGFDPAERGALLTELMRWTEGHPYMSHRLAERLAAGDGEGPPGPRVAALVARLFLDGGVHGDANLAGAARRLQAGADDLPEMLALYRSALIEGGVEADGRRAATVRLLLSGLVTWRATPAGPRLRVRNPIYAAVFDLAWVAEQLDRRPFSAAFEGWIRAGRAPDWLLRGEVLASAQAWAEGRADLSRDEVGFLLRSAEVWRAEEAERAELEQRRLGAALADEQRSRGRLRSVGLAVIVGLSVIIALVSISFNIKLSESEQYADAARIRAEDAASRALRANAGLLLEQARAALALPDLATAESSAAASLLAAEAPEARGVLMMASACARPTLLWSHPLRPGAALLRVVAADHVVLAPDGEDAVALDADTGRLLTRMVGAGSAGRALTPDGAQAITQLARGAPLVRYDLSSGASEPLPFSLSQLVDAAVSRDGQILYLQTDAYTQQAVRLDTGEILWSRPSPVRSVCRVSLSPQEDRLAVGCTSGMLDVLDPADGRLLLRTGRRPPGGYAHAWLGAAGALLFGGRGESSDGGLHLWRDGRIEPAPDPEAPPRWGQALRPRWDDLESDGMAGGADGGAWVGLLDGTVLGLDGSGGLLTRFRAAPRQVRVAAHGARLYTVGSDDLLRAWDLAGLGGRAPQPRASNFRATIFDAGSDGLLVGEDRALTLRDPATGQVRWAVALPEGLSPAVGVVRGGVITTLNGDGAVWRHQDGAWQVLGARAGSGGRGALASTSGEVVALLTAVGPSLVLRGDAVERLPCGANGDAMALDPDGRWLALSCGTGADQEPLRIQDLKVEGDVLEVPTTGTPSTALAWLVQGEALLVGRTTGEIQRWTRAGGLGPWAKAGGRVMDVEVSLDGRYVAACDTAGLVRIFDASGALVAELGPLSPGASRLKFDREHLIARLIDGGVVVWPLEVLDQRAADAVRTATARWGAVAEGGQITWAAEANPAQNAE